MKQALGPGEWRNWAGTATATAARRAQPRSEAEISAAVKDAAAAGLRVRALGSGHSFTPAAATSGVALDLSLWTGVTAADTRTGLVTVRSGTTLRALNAALAEIGLALVNLGDIDAQTIAGALATGTHGTGARLGGLATQVEALDLVLADGSLVSCSASARPELFAAARVGLGALGVVTAVTLRCVPSFTLAADERPMPVERVIEEFGALAAANDHFEFYWFPYGRQALVKRNNRVPPAGRGPGGTGRGADAGVAPVLGVRGDGERRVRDAVPAGPGRAPAHPRAQPALLGRAVRAVLHGRVVPGVRYAPPGSLRRVRVRRST